MLRKRPTISLSILLLSSLLATSGFSAIYIGIDFNGNPTSGWTSIVCKNDYEYEIREVEESYIGFGSEILLSLSDHFYLRLLPLELRFQDLYGKVLVINNALDIMLRFHKGRFVPYIFGGLQMHHSSKAFSEYSFGLGLGIEFMVKPKLSIFAESQIWTERSGKTKFYYEEGETEPSIINLSGSGAGGGRYSIGLRFPLKLKGGI